MNYFPNSDEEISLIKFIAKFQYLSVNDAKYFFRTQKYYRARVTSLVKKKYLRRIKSTLVLDEIGVEYCKLSNFEHTILNRNKKYFPRLLYISNLGAFFYSSKNIKYTPSYAIKDKDMFTIIARKFIGVLEINGIDYLAYHISEQHDNKYIASVIYDIEKEKKYRNIIVFVDNINRINISNFSLGMNRVLIIEDTIANREKLKYMHSMNWSELMEDMYKNRVFLSEYNFCDYSDNKNRYIDNFYFIDAEKITKIKFFLRENKNKNIDIVCSKDLEEQLRKELPNCHYHTVDLEEYIDKEQNIYE